MFDLKSTVRVYRGRWHQRTIASTEQCKSQKEFNILHLLKYLEILIASVVILHYRNLMLLIQMKQRRMLKSQKKKRRLPLKMAEKKVIYLAVKTR